MKTYGMSWNDAMDTPLHAFWLICSNVDRLLAESDIRGLVLHSVVQGDADSRQQLYEKLKSEQGTIIIQKEKLDSFGLSRLKNLNKAY